MKQVFGWILFVVFGAGGGVYAISELFALRWLSGLLALVIAIFWLWLAGSVLLGLY